MVKLKKWGGGTQAFWCQFWIRSWSKKKQSTACVGVLGLKGEKKGITSSGGQGFFFKGGRGHKHGVGVPARFLDKKK